MPKLGESIMEATILKWFKQPGDTVKMDETVLEIATDKVDSEVPSTAEGIIEELLYNVNDVVPIGTVIARISQGGASTAPSSRANPQTESNQPEQTVAPQASIVDTPAAASSSVAPSTSSSGGGGNMNRFYSP